MIFKQILSVVKKFQKVWKRGLTVFSFEPIMATPAETSLVQKLKTENKLKPENKLNPKGTKNDYTNSYP